MPIETPFGALTLVFFEDRGSRDLRELRRFLLLAGLTVSAGTFLFLLLFLGRQFVPYRQIVSSLGAYAGKTLPLDGLYERMAVLRRDRSSEIGAIAEGVCAMISLVQSNVAQVEDYAAQLRGLAERDELTGLWNRRYLDRTLAVEVERAGRYGSPLSVIMIDLDHFKRVNDDYGHPVGDFVLASMGRFLREQSRATDFPGRWGGEEFLVVCPAISGDEARRFAERLRRTLEGISFRPELFLTASFGVAQLRLGEAVHEMVARADGALYQAKAGGRNRVVVSSGQS
jgi:diguanylate cyclase (GGDEF)-like protein